MNRDRLWLLLERVECTVAPTPAAKMFWLAWLALMALIIGLAVYS